MSCPQALEFHLKKIKCSQKPLKKSGKTKTAIILEAVDEKLGLSKSREELIRETAGWLTYKEATELKESLAVFNQISEGDWE